MIASTDVEARHRRLQSLRFHGTGDWLLRNDKYLKWKHNHGPPVLCCYGIREYGLKVQVTYEEAVLTPWVYFIAGSGKSVLAYVLLFNPHQTQLLTAGWAQVANH